MDKLKAMETFIRVVEAGSLVKAAHIMSVRKSTVSMTLKQLEDSMGVRLLQRSARGSSLTEEGRVYYENCRKIIADISNLEQSFRASGTSPTGRVRVDLPNSVAQALLIPSLNEFKTRYPGISLALGVTDRRVDLIGEAIDCVIRTGALEDSSLIGRRIGDYQWVVCATPDYLARKNIPTDPQELVTHDIIGYFTAGAQFMERWDFERDGRDMEVSLSSTLAVNDTLAYIQCALEGHGFIRLTEFAAQSYIARGQLVEVLRPYRPKASPVSILFPSGRHLSPAIRVFADWAAQLFAKATVNPDART